MPYIEHLARVQIDTGIRKPVTVGELNYAITVLCRDYFRNNGGRYQQINDVIESTIDTIYVFGLYNSKARIYSNPINQDQLRETILAIGDEYYKSNGPIGIHGAVKAAGLEFYRRIAVPYEDKKINEHGDVY